MIHKTSPQPSGKKEEEGMAELLGESFALLQHGIDKVIDWGFSKMREIPPQEKEEQTIKNPALRSLANAGRGIARFFGSAGSAYYRSYEELKRKNNTKQY